MTGSRTLMVTAWQTWPWAACRRARCWKRIAMVDKIIGYEQDAPEGPWTGNLNLVVDEVTGDFDFQACCGCARGSRSGGPDGRPNRPRRMEQVTARQAILDAFDAGRLLVNYDGHGSQAVWVSDSVFGTRTP